MFAKLSRKGSRSFSAGTPSFLVFPSCEELTLFPLLQQTSLRSQDATTSHLDPSVRAQRRLERRNRSLRRRSGRARGRVELERDEATVDDQEGFDEAVGEHCEYHVGRRVHRARSFPSSSLFDFLVDLHPLAASAASASTTSSAIRSSSTSPSSSSSRLSASSAPFPAKLWVRPLTLSFPPSSADTLLDPTAGTEVKTLYRPETKSSSFPIPSPSSIFSSTHPRAEAPTLQIWVPRIRTRRWKRRSSSRFVASGSLFLLFPLTYLLPAAPAGEEGSLPQVDFRALRNPLCVRPSFLPSNLPTTIFASFSGQIRSRCSGGEPR
jgi:hypothetical protein